MEHKIISFAMLPNHCRKLIKLIFHENLCKETPSTHHLKKEVIQINSLQTLRLEF